MRRTFCLQMVEGAFCFFYILVYHDVSVIRLKKRIGLFALKDLYASSIPRKNMQKDFRPILMLLVNFSIIWQQEADSICGIALVSCLNMLYFTTPFSKYSARFVSITLVTWSAATFSISCLTIMATRSSNEVV